MVEGEPNSKKIRVAAVGDIHVRDSMGGHYREFFTNIGAEADVLCLCGDLTDLGKPEEAELLAEDMRNCTIPIVAVLGNHDHQSDQPEVVKHILGKVPNVTMLDQEPVEHFGIGFAGVKGFIGGFDQFSLNAFGEKFIKEIIHERDNEAYALENQLKNMTNEKRVILMHYTPIRATVANESSDIMPFLGATRYEQVIDQFGATVVFHGHANAGPHSGKTKTNIPVFNVALPLLQTMEPKRTHIVHEI